VIRDATTVKEKLIECNVNRDTNTTMISSVNASRVTRDNEVCNRLAQEKGSGHCLSSANIADMYMKCQCTLISGTRAGQACNNNARYIFKNVPVCGHHKNCKKLPSTAPVKKTNEKSPSVTETPVNQPNQQSKMTFNNLPDDIIQVLCDTHLRDRKFRSLANLILTNKRNHEVCAGHLKELLKNVKYTTIPKRVYLNGEFRQTREGKMLDVFFRDPSVKHIGGGAGEEWVFMTIGEEVMGVCEISDTMYDAWGGDDQLFEKNEHKMIVSIYYKEPFLKLLLKPYSGYKVSENFATGHDLRELGFKVISASCYHSTLA